MALAHEEQKPGTSTQAAAGPYEISSYRDAGFLKCSMREQKNPMAVLA